MRDDVVNCNLWETHRAMRSFDGKIEFRQIAPHYDTKFLSWKSTKTSDQLEPKQNLDDDWKNHNVLCRADFLFGFHFGVGTHKKFAERRLAVWIVPYWSVVIPLTLFSAYLLLSKSRKSIRNKITEPAADEGA